jgi:hypothetical protein
VESLRNGHGVGVVEVGTGLHYRRRQCLARHSLSMQETKG